MARPRFRYQVFISYSSAQRRLVRAIVEQWRALGLKIFYDGDLEFGVEVPTALDWARERSRRTVLFITPESVKSGWVQKEINLPIYEDPNALRRRLIPVLLEPVSSEQIPPRVRTLHRADLTDASIRGDVLHRLLKSIGLKKDPKKPWPIDLPRVEATGNGEASAGKPKPRAGGGAIAPYSPYYLVRKAEREIFDYYRFDEMPGQSFTVKGHNQSGKSSLLASLYAHALRNDQVPCRFDCHGWDAVTFESANALFREIATSIMEALRLGRHATDHWSPELPKQSLTRFLEQQVLARVDRPVLLLFDDAQKVFDNRAVCRQMFQVLKSWHDRRATDGKKGEATGWHQLGLVVAHTSDPDLGDNSFFDVAHQLVLEDFDTDEIDALNEQYGRPLSGRKELRGLMRLVDGHPHLVRLALDEMARKPRTFASLKDSAMADDGPFASYLRRISQPLEKDERLMASFRKVMGGQVIDERSFQRLRSIGLIRGRNRKAAAIRCKLYALYFSKTHS